MAIAINNWEFTKKIIRIGHNRRVKQHFKDIVSDTATQSGRQVIKTALIIRPEDSASEVLCKMQYFSNYLTQNGLVSLPDGWQIKRGQDIPQLAIIYRDTSKNSISGNYTLHIPHYNGNKNPKMPAYKKGSSWARWILKDNSHLIVHAYTETEALRVIKILERNVDTKFKTIEDGNLVTGKIKGRTYKDIRVAPIRADYYPNGKSNALPLWRHYF